MVGILLLFLAQGQIGGVGVNLNDPGKTPSAQRIKEMGNVPTVRSPFYGDTKRLIAAFNQMGPTVRAVVIIDDQAVKPTKDAPLDSDEYARRLAKKAREVVEACRGRILAIEVWNEPDNDHPTAVSTYLTPEQYSKILRAVYAEVKAADKKVNVIIGGLCSGKLEWVTDMLKAFPKNSRPFDGIGLHPYGQRVPGVDYGPFGDMEDIVKRYAAAAGVPVWVTEFGVPLEELMDGKRTRAQALQMQAAYFLGAVQVFRKLGPKTVAYWSLHSVMENQTEHGTSKTFTGYDANGKLNPLGLAVRQAMLTR